MAPIDTLYVVGRGAFAATFLDHFSRTAQTDYGLTIRSKDWPTGDQPTAVVGSLVLHAGSGRQLPEVMAWCQKHQVPMIQASTGLKFDLPEPLTFTFIDAPNLSIPILKLMGMLQLAEGFFKDFEVSIVESHQAAKQSTPGTAVRLAELLGVNADTIQSVREIDRQRHEFEVPDEHLDGHAIHSITIEGMGAQIQLGTRVMGRTSYLHGVVALARIVGKLEHRHYDIANLVAQGDL